MSSIQTLPPRTVRILGCSQVITTSESVVKELIDNALDAQAAAVFVEIFVNTIDLLQVRDDGHGVAPEDRDMICRRYCTSKISSEEDLRAVGGRWLGFRGEALTSVAELCGSLQVTTRIEGETAAVALRVAHDGEVVSRENASHPVGTSVRVTDLFTHVPVRKQAALKASAKCLSKVKRIMQAYAMARPSVRFSLRVLKAKNQNGNWMYAPKPNTYIEDAAFKVVGKDCASQCHFSVLEEDDIKIEMFSPKVDAIPDKINNVGHFLSVDSRPMSASRGFLKLFVDTFRERLKSCNSSLSNVKDPFLWMNLICPKGFYDANVEPSKDDVIFEDTQKVLCVVKKLFDTSYPSAVEFSVTAPDHAEVVNQEPITVFEDDEDCSPRPPNKRQRTWKRNLSNGSDDSEDSWQSMLSDAAGREIDGIHSQLDDEEAEAPLKALNPFVIAKLNAPRNFRKIVNPSNSLYIEESCLNGNTHSAAKPTALPPYPPWALPTPKTSSPFRQLLRRLSTDHTDEVGSPVPRTELDDWVVADSPERCWPSPNERSGFMPVASDTVSARQLPVRPLRSTSLSSSPMSCSDADHNLQNTSSHNAPSFGIKQRLSADTKRVPERRQRFSQRALDQSGPTDQSETSPKRKLRPSPSNRNIQSMFVGRKVNRPFKPPAQRRLPKTNSRSDIELPENHQQSSQYSTDSAMARAGQSPPCPTSVRPCHGLSMPSSSRESSTPSHNGFDNVKPNEYLDPASLLQGPFHQLQNLVKPLSLAIDTLKDLMTVLNEIIGDARLEKFLYVPTLTGSYPGEGDNALDAETGMNNEPFSSSVTSSPPSDEEVDSWRAVILGWLEEREGAEFVQNLLEEERREQCEIADMRSRTGAPLTID